MVPVAGCGWAGAVCTHYSTAVATMMPRMTNPVLVFILTAAASGVPSSQGVSLAYECTGVAGFSMAAPNWVAERDSASQQVVRLEYRSDNGEAMVSWSRNGEVYVRSQGIGIAMSSGFVILVPGESLIETYVYNAGTTELLFTQTRSGSSLLPNIVKAFRGTCTGARRGVSP